MTSLFAALPHARRPWLVAAISAILAAAITLVSPSLGAGAVALISLLVVALYQISYAVLLLVILAPWASLVNVLTGGRLVPLGLDVFMIVLAGCILFFAPLSLKRDWDAQTPARIKTLRWLVLALLAVGAGNVLNPAGLGVLGGLEGFRAFFLPMLAAPVGYFLGITTKGLSDRLLATIIVSAAVVACMGVRQALAPADIDLAIVQSSQSGLLPFLITGTNRLRAFSPLPGPFHFGLILMIASVATASMLSDRFRWVQVAVLLLLLVALALNATRTNWLGTGTGLLIVTLASFKRTNVLLWTLRTGLLATIAIGIGLFLLQSNAFSVIGAFGAGLFQPFANTSFVFRVLGWYHDVLPAIQQAPTIGHGTGMAKDGLGPFTSHNLFFKVLLEGGAVSLVLYLATILLAGMLLLKNIRSSRLARVALASLIGVHAAGLFAPILDAYPGNLYFWLILGAGLGKAPLPIGASSLPLPQYYVQTSRRS